MIAMPFHPSNVYTIEELNNNLEDILRDVEKKALVSLDNNNIDFKLTDKIHDGKLYVEQGVIAGCAVVALRTYVMPLTFYAVKTLVPMNSR